MNHTDPACSLEAAALLGRDWRLARAYQRVGLAGNNNNYNNDAIQQFRKDKAPYRT